MSRIEEIIVKIDTSKEILSVLPKNNQKNMNVYVAKVEELKEEFASYEGKMLEEMGSRVKKMSKMETDPEIAMLEKEVSEVESILYLTNDIKTSYEKMGFDRAMHNLRYYYKKSLKVVNETILYCLKKFKEVGISLRLEDFTYSKYVKEYIASFFIQGEEVDLKKIQNKFEEIYWKCPNIITHIELNIRYLFVRHEKVIDKYYDKQEVELLGKVTTEDIVNRYMDLKKQLVEKKQQDKSTIITDLIEGKLNVKEFSETAIEGRYARFISPEILSNADETKLNEIDVNMNQLLNSVYEYQNYLKYKFVVDDVKKIYMEKDKHKNTFMETKKQIATIEKRILKMSAQIDKKGIKKAADKLIAEQERVILEVKELYREFDTNKVCSKIVKELNENSTIKEALYLASSFYNYLFQCIEDHDKELTQDDVEKDILGLGQFMIWPYSTIVNNIGMLEERDVLTIIKDRYQLLNITMTREDLDQDNLDALMVAIEGIGIGHTIRKNKIDIEELGYIGEFKKVLNA